MLCSLPRFCLMHTVDRFDSEGWFSSSQVIFSTVFCVFLWKKHAVKRKDAISWFSIYPGSAEAQVRWGGKIKYSCAKNCGNWSVYVKIIASQRQDFFETQCSSLLIESQQLFCSVSLICFRRPMSTIFWRHISFWRAFKHFNNHYQLNGPVFFNS